MKLNIFDPREFKIHYRSPLVSGMIPQRIIIEIRKNQNKTALTYWYYWDYDLYRGDHLDWEPVSLVYIDDKLEEIYSRVHDGLVRFLPTYGARPLIYFARSGHTPVVRIKNRQTDAEFFRMNDRMDAIREKWLDYWYRQANSIGWKTVTRGHLPQLETDGGPTLDSVNWKTWGKHSVYLRI